MLLYLYIQTALSRLPFRIRHMSTWTFFSQWPILSPHKILTYLHESSCMCIQIKNNERPSSNNPKFISMTYPACSFQKSNMADTNRKPKRNWFELSNRLSKEIRQNSRYKIVTFFYTIISFDFHTTRFDLDALLLITRESVRLNERLDGSWVLSPRAERLKTALTTIQNEAQDRWLHMRSIKGCDDTLAGQSAPVGLTAWLRTGLLAVTALRSVRGRPRHE